MNQYHNFNPDEKRMALAALLQNPEQMPQDTFKMPGTPVAGGGGIGMGLMDLAKMLKGGGSSFGGGSSPFGGGSATPNADYLNSGYSPG
jgi:hypothetical protein